jgi:integrase/recombinase XerD
MGVRFPLPAPPKRLYHQYVTSSNICCTSTVPNVIGCVPAVESDSRYAPMLKIYRRHVPECKHAAKGTKYNKCSCPIWVDGMHKGTRTRRSLDTFSWEEASKELLRLTTGTDAKNCSVSDAVKDYLADRERCKLAESGIKKYREVLTPLAKFCEGRSITLVRALDLATLTKFTDGLTDSSLVQGKKIERLRTFFKFCMKRGWCEDNPAKDIDKPKVDNAPVVPFTEDQQKAILSAIEKYPTRNSFGYDNRKRMLAFVLTLRYTAFRMSDVT